MKKLELKQLIREVINEEEKMIVSSKKEMQDIMTEILETFSGFMPFIDQNVSNYRQEAKKIIDIIYTDCIDDEENELKQNYSEAEALELLKKLQIAVIRFFT